MAIGIFRFRVEKRTERRRRWTLIHLCSGVWQWPPHFRCSGSAVNPLKTLP